MKTLLFVMLTAALFMGCGDSNKKLSPVGTYIYMGRIPSTTKTDASVIVIYSDSISRTEKAYIFEDGKLIKIDTMKF